MFLFLSNIFLWPEVNLCSLWYNFFLSADYEKVVTHKLMVRASTSEGDDSATCYVYVKVVNVNDNVPVFDSAVYKIHIAEDVRVGESVLRVSANDRDNNNNGDNNNCENNNNNNNNVNKENDAYNNNNNNNNNDSDQLTYTIVKGNRNLFAVDAGTGWLKVIGRLDRERRRAHKVKVSARDEGGNDK